MPTSERPWIVSPHEPIVKHEANLWTVQGRLGKGPITRRMSIVRRRDGSLVFYHPVPLDEGALAEVLAWGRPAELVVAHAEHGVDATPFAKKLGVKIHGPRADEARLRERFDLAGFLEDLPADPDVSFESVPGSKFGEPVELVRSGERVSLVFSDAIQAHGDTAPLPFRLLGFRGGPRVVPLFRLLFTSDRAALKAYLARLAETPGLARLVPCHGFIEERDAAGALRRAAAAL
ncbi:MAG: hypothetical protein QM767_26405 [Anaeromyxobacter sp.]